MSDSCPYCPPPTSWGGSKEMFGQLKLWHDKGHPTKPLNNNDRTKKAPKGISRLDRHTSLSADDDSIPQPNNEGSTREQIRIIWRPLLDKSTHAQEMAYLITAATDETEALINKAVIEARLSERAWAYKNMRDHSTDQVWVEIAQKRYERLKKEMEDK